MDPQEHKNRLEDAYRFIKGEISSLEEKMRIADLDIQKVYEDLYSKMNWSQMCFIIIWFGHN